MEKSPQSIYIVVYTIEEETKKKIKNHNFILIATVLMLGTDTMPSASFCSCRLILFLNFKNYKSALISVYTLRCEFKKNIPKFCGASWDLFWWKKNTAAHNADFDEENIFLATDKCSYYKSKSKNNFLLCDIAWNAPVPPPLSEEEKSRWRQRAEILFRLSHCILAFSISDITYSSYPEWRLRFTFFRYIEANWSHYL